MESVIATTLSNPFVLRSKGAMPEHLLRDADVELLEEYQEAAEGDIGDLLP